jgi:hypothetical protein
VWEAVDLWASLYRKNTIDGDRLLTQLGLADNRHAWFMTLSGGFLTTHLGRWARRPRRRVFFRSIGSTVGVAAFGSIMLTRYHSAFEQSMPAHVPVAALPYFANPLRLVQVRPQMETAFARFPGGTALLQALFDNVRASLASGLHQIFVCSAVIMSLGVLLHVALRREPLRTRSVEPELAGH